MIDIGDDLSKVAEMLVKTALSPLIGEVERQELFKLLTTYHLGICKVTSKKGEKEEDDANSFNGFRNRVAAATSRDGEDNPA